MLSRTERLNRRNLSRNNFNLDLNNSSAVDTNLTSETHDITKSKMNSSPSKNANDKNDEFDTFAISTDKVLINPSTKVGKELFDKLSDVTVKDEERLTGKASEAMKLRVLMQGLESKGNFLGCLTFVDKKGKFHDLATNPENTSIEELIVFNNESVFNFRDEIADSNSMIKLSSKPKKTEIEKAFLRESIDRRAKNQIVKKFLSKVVSPNFYSLITKKDSNASVLWRKDPDQNEELTIDGTVLYLLIAKQICPSSVSMIENIKCEAKSLTIGQFNNDVSLALNKFEELNERIKSFGKIWDDAILACFKLLYTVEDN